MLLFISICVALLGMSQALTIEQANAYIDYLLDGPLPNAEEYKKLYPMKIPSFQIYMYKGQENSYLVEMIKGEVVNASEVHRTGDCAVFSGKNQQGLIQCQLRMIEIYLEYYIKVDALNGQCKEVKDFKEKFLGEDHLRVHAEDIIAGIDISFNEVDGQSNLVEAKLKTTAKIEIQKYLSQVLGDLKDEIQADVMDKIKKSVTEKLKMIIAEIYKDLFEKIVRSDPIPL